MMNEWITPEEAEAILLSLKISFTAVALCLPLGVFTALVFLRLRFPLKDWLEGALHLPLVLPPVVTGYLLLLLFGHQGPLGKVAAWFGLDFGFNWKGAVLASVIVSFPLLYNAVKLGLEKVDPQLEEAAQTMGMGPIKTLFQVTLPLATSGMITGALLAFARSLGEFGATITFVSNIPGETQTLPLALYGQAQIPGAEASALKLCIISVCMALLALGMTKTLQRQRAQ